MNSIFLAFILITMGSSQYLTEIGIGDYIGLLGYVLIVARIIYCYIFSKEPTESRNKTLKIYAVVLALFLAGLALQELPVTTILRLMGSMVIIATIAVMSEYFLNSFEKIRTAAYGIFAGGIICFIIALCSGTSITSGAVEGIIPFGFNGGFEHKNYFSAMMLSSFSGIYLYRKNVKKIKGDIIVLAVQAALILLSNSRGGYILFALFLCLMNTDILNKKAGYGNGVLKRINSFYNKLYNKLYGKYQSFKPVIIAFAVIIGMLLLYKILFSSGSYRIRLAGLRNYLRMYSNDAFHMIFGNAEMAFRNSGMSYNDNVRTIIGYDGTVEMAALSILIKNGILGLIGYFIVIANIIRTAITATNKNYKTAIISIISILLVSTFVETYMVNLNVAFGPYCFCALLGLCGMCSKEKYSEKTSDDKKRVLMICNTPYHILIAANLAYTVYRNEKTDIIVSDQMNGGGLFVDRLNKSSLFNRAYYIESKQFDYDSKLKKNIRTLFPKAYLKKISVLPDISNHYDVMLFANIGLFNSLMYHYLKGFNRNLRLEMFEDGISTYSRFYERWFARCYASGRKNSLFGIIKRNLYVYNHLERYWVFNKSFFLWKPECDIYEMNKISSDNKELIVLLNDIFDYNSMTDRYSEKVIFFEESFYASGRNVDDVSLVEGLAEEFGKENIFIKIHPRNPENRFKSLGYKTNENTSVPWEIIALNIDIESKVLITIASAAIINVYILLGKNVPSRMYYRTFSNVDIDKDVVEVIEKIAEIYDEYITVF